MTAKIQAVTFQGPAGRLEGILKYHSTSRPQALAVVCHPHPLYQGTMHNKVVFAAAEAFFGLGCNVLRFNFRGVSLSAGTYDDGRGETDDALSAVRFLRDQYPGPPCLIAGFSFGAWMAIEAARRDSTLVSLTALAPPLKHFNQTILTEFATPKLFLQGTADDICPAEALTALYPAIPEPKQIVLFSGVGHFFAGHLPELRAAIARHAILLGL